MVTMLTTITTTDPQTASAPKAADERIDLLGLSRERLAAVIAPAVDRPFRAKQIYPALYERAVRDLSEITELPRELRERLAGSFRVGLPEISSRHISADGTAKYLFRLRDGATIE